MVAALDERPITQAFSWTTQPGDTEAANILRRHRYQQLAEAVAGHAYGAESDATAILHGLIPACEPRSYG